MPQRVLLIDPELPDVSSGPSWWAQVGSFTPTEYLMDALDELPFEELDAEQALQVALAAERIAARAQAIQLKAVARFTSLRPPRRGDAEKFVGAEPVPPRSRRARHGAERVASRCRTAHRVGL